MERNRITEIVRQIGLYSGLAIADTVSKFEQLDYASIDDEKFDQWFNPEVFKRARNPGSYFIASVRRELSRGTFKASDTSSTTTIEDVSVEDFEKEWDEWCRLVEDLSLDPENPDVPGKGTLIGELHCVDGVRGISTGDGGFVYLDGTVSQRFKRFEDLTIQEKEDLINAFDERNTRGSGRLIIADALLEKMRSLAGGSAV